MFFIPYAQKVKNISFINVSVLWVGLGWILVPAKLQDWGKEKTRWTFLEASAQHCEHSCGENELHLSWAQCSVIIKQKCLLE